MHAGVSLMDGEPGGRAVGCTDSRVYGQSGVRAVRCSSYKFTAVTTITSFVIVENNVGI